MENEKIESEYTNEVVCPWCGYEFSDSWEFNHDECYTDYECPECERLFDFTVNISVDYTSTRKQCDKCEYEISNDITNPYIYGGHNWTIYKCKICNNEMVKVSAIAEDGKPFILPIDAPRDYDEERRNNGK